MWPWKPFPAKNVTTQSMRQVSASSGLGPSMTITGNIFQPFLNFSKNCLPFPDLQILFPCTCTVLWDAPVIDMASWALWGSKLTKHSGKASRQWWRNCQKISEWGVPPVFRDNWAATTKEDTFKQLFYKDEHDRTGTWLYRKKDFLGSLTHTELQIHYTVNSSWGTYQFHVNRCLFLNTYKLMYFHFPCLRNIWN